MADVLRQVITRLLCSFSCSFLLQLYLQFCDELIELIWKYIPYMLYICHCELLFLISSILDKKKNKYLSMIQELLQSFVARSPSLLSTLYTY